MKISIWVLFFLFFSGGRSWASTNVDVSGEVNTVFTAGILPTSERGSSAFTMPSLFLDLEVPLQENNLLHFTLDGSEQNTTSSDTRFQVRAREAYVSLMMPFQTVQSVRFGLVPQLWQEFQYENYSYRFLGKDAWAITEKWGYLNFSDLGLTYLSEDSEDSEGFFNWALSFTNGEGVREKEMGPHKEASLHMRWTPDELWSASFQYVYGGYEKYGTSGSKKERIQAAVQYQMNENCLWGLELLRAVDPADAIKDYKMAEGVDVSDFLGQDIIGQGGSLSLTISAGSFMELFLRYDYLNTLLAAPGKDLKTALVAWSYRWTEDVKLALAFDHTQYGDQFAPGTRDRSKAEIATQVFF